jgi:crotonobetainyl-CoA:carnitine CoA-transferase CaiB-like acyl-CoA transferase
VRLQPPRFGAHTDELLRGLGYRDEEIQSLRAQAVVA